MKKDSCEVIVAPYSAYLKAAYNLLLRGELLLEQYVEMERRFYDLA